MKTFKSSLLIVTVAVLLSVTLTQAQVHESFSEKEIENLISGINSENNGLMRSSVYFAGKYQIEAVVETLVDKLESEEEPSNIILIAMTIYKIGDREALMKVLDTAKSSENERVKHMLNAIVAEYLIETETEFVRN
ncbi:MAG: hypothetical protein U5K00_06770 [Melioribacteraceae bacterium]|nr:hypothetical protein [Melioribacteraceae bacterium]